MDHTPESSLQQAAKLAIQAAAQMRKAAALAEQATQLLQRALAQVDQASPSQPSVPVQMSVGSPKRKTKQHIRPETTRFIESTTLRQFEQPGMLTGQAERAISSPPEHIWEDGDNWWKPLQPTLSSEAD